MRTETFLNSTLPLLRVILAGLALSQSVVLNVGADDSNKNLLGVGVTRPLQSVGFTSSDGKKFNGEMGGKRLTLEDPDNPRSPTAWDSPIAVTNIKSGKLCKTDNWIVSSVYAGYDGKVAVVVAINAAMRDIHFVDLASCRSIYPSITVYSDEVQISYNQIAIFPGCECTDKTKTHCQCQAARVYRLGSDYRPLLDEKESLSLTKRYLGVEFTGERWVSRPMMPQAKLIKGPTQ